jgi:O-antigen/teichoic acid export membrane protein
MQVPGNVANLIVYTVRNAPWTLLASLAPPLSNYVIILLLSAGYGLAAGGQFRLLLSIFGLLTIFTLPDTGKIAVRYLVLGRTGVIRPLLAARVRWGLLGLLSGVAAAAYLHHRGDALALPVLILALLLPLGEAADLYAQINQARRQFLTAAVYSALKYGGVTLLAFGLVAVGADVAWFLCSYFVLLFAFNMLFLSLHEEASEAPSADSPVYVREGVHLSGSGVFPILLENADKLIISYFLGLEALAIYTIGVSTGRLLLNFIKPVLTIYFPILVVTRPDRHFLAIAFVGLSAIGVAGAWALQFYFTGVLGSEYLPAYPLAAIILAGFGLYFANAVVYYSAVYHKDSAIRVPAITNIATFAIIVPWLIVAAASGGSLALAACAASYPLRDLVAILAIALLTRKEGSHAQSRAVL